MSSSSSQQQLWNFDNSFARLPERFFARVVPEPVSCPRIIRVNDALAKHLGLCAERLQREQDIALVLSGNACAPGSEVIAQAYAGHQFGGFVPSLGDGRAALLGEHITPQGERYDIQLKGSGRTPFSRRGDGRAALGPMIREYIIGEALHGLGIPTTRMLALVTTGEQVFRETALPGAIVTRVASSHIRIGTFEYFASRGDHEAVKVLADYTIARHYPACLESAEPYLDLCRAFFKRQAELVARWIDVGFVHGVMNTDNISLAGESIDFGPCAFVDTYEPDAVFSSIDTGGRYAYSAQPAILEWNLARFLESILVLLDGDEQRAIAKAELLLGDFRLHFAATLFALMRAKLGLHTQEAGDRALVQGLLKVMQEQQLDYTATLRAISRELEADDALLRNPDFARFEADWRGRLSDARNGRTFAESLEAMRRHNPARIARNHLVEEAISAGVERGDFSVMDGLLEALAAPFSESTRFARFELPPPAAMRGSYRTFCGT